MSLNGIMWNNGFEFSKIFIGVVVVVFVGALERCVIVALLV